MNVAELVGTGVMLILGLAALALLVVFIQLIAGEVRESRGGRRR